MRVCSTCGFEVDKSSLFCPGCGTKAPPDLPTDTHASLKVQPNVDPLASTAPASVSPARSHASADSASRSPVSPLAGTALQPSVKPEEASVSASPLSPVVPSGSSRGKTAPLSAVPHLHPLVPPQAAVSPVFGSPSRGARAPASPAPPAPPRSGPELPADPRALLPIAPGRRVLVQWANGQRYPGVVEQIQGPQSLVRFDAGEQRWVETRYILPGG
jgi:hypothetical protein